MCVAFLRGINVTGRRVKNDELVACFEDMGFLEVSGFLASGNIVFDAAGVSPDKLEPTIEKALDQQLGYAVPTFVRTAPQIDKIQAHAPFPTAVVAATDGNMQVALLGARPSAPQRKAAMSVTPPEDLIDLVDREMYWLPRVGISDSKLNLNALTEILGPMTIRTRRTIVRLSAKLG